MQGGHMAIDARAIVAPGAQVAADVEIGPFSVIGPEVVIGPGTRIGPHVVIAGATRIGAGNRIFQFASVGDAPQDKKYAGEPTRLEIGDNNVIRECVTINRGTTHDQGVTRIGDDNLFMAYSHVAHDCIVGSHCVLANLATLGGHVQLGDWVIMGGLAAVHQFCRIGAHAFLANNAAVTRDVPPYVMAVGQPAEPHSINATGLARRGFTPAQVRTIKQAFRTLYRSDLPLAEATARLQVEAANSPELRPFVEFLAGGKRSLVR
jgi:UDP-N-acetylglucosamine acyltransferase